MKRAVCLLLTLSLASCGGGGGSSSSIPSSPNLQTRTDAVNQTVASNTDCSSLTPFYWEIGDKDSALASGTGGDGSSTAPTATTDMAIASASKWVFASWVLEDLSISAQDPLTSDQIAKLHFTSGYDQMNNAICIGSASIDTVEKCLVANNGHGGTNGDQTVADEGKFFYNGGHMQQLAHDLSLGGDFINDGHPGNIPKLNAVIAGSIAALQGQGSSFLYTNAMLAGGISTTAAIYSAFLREILSDDLIMHDYLGADPVCTWTNQPSTCNAVSSPLSASGNNEQWHYSLGHWVEDDPTVGDGAFSSPGAGGFYPWIDVSKTWYGVLARFLSPSDSNNSIGVASVYCGRMMRKAWLTGQAQLTSPTP